MIRPSADLEWIRKFGFRSWWTCIFEHRLQYFGGFKWWGWPVRKLGWLIHNNRRRLEGARKVKLGETAGCVCDEGLEIEFGGMCPVQGDGVIDGRICYYRSRGNGWQFHVARADATDGDHGESAALADDAWEYFEDSYIWPAGGYVAREVSEACIRKAARVWREAGRP